MTNFIFLVFLLIGNIHTSYIGKEGATIFTLSKNELEVVSLLWREKVPLSRTEIINLSPDRSWKASSIHILLNSLLRKEAIIVDGFVRTGKNYGRTYRTTLTQEEYAAMQLSKNVSASSGGSESLVGIFSALMQTEDMNQKVLEDLQDLLDKKKEELRH